MSWYNNMMEDMSKFVSRKAGHAVVVTSFQEEANGYSANTGCETCGYGSTGGEIEVTFWLDPDLSNGAHMWTYYGPLSSLLDEIVLGEGAS